MAKREGPGGKSHGEYNKEINDSIQRAVGKFRHKMEQRDTYDGKHRRENDRKGDAK